MTRLLATRVTAAALAAAVTAVLTACSAPVPEPSPTPVPTAPAATSAPSVPVAPATLAPIPAPIPPVSVVVASLGIDMPVTEVGVETGGFMELPVDPAIAGWYRYGSDPAAGAGNVVLSAHVDAPDYPIGPFSRLRDLVPGEVIEVTDAAGVVHRYVAQSVTYYPKTALPTADLFSRSGPPGLVLITCGGEYDPAVGRYADNVVAIATPAP